MYINLCNYLIHDMFIYLLKMYNMFIRFACSFALKYRL